MVGWFAPFALWPLEMYWPHWPEWAFPIRHIGIFGLAVALFAALALLLDPPNGADSGAAHAPSDPNC